jgi:hypothetical protein
MLQTSCAPTENIASISNHEATLRDLDRELAHQNAELADALEWLRQRGDAALLFDSELFEQLTELDELAADLNGMSPAPLPGHCTRC